MWFLSKVHCPHFAFCSGCTHLLDAPWPTFIKEAPFPLDLISEHLTKWRMRSKLPIRGTIAHPQIGLFKKKSHEVVEIPLCVVHHPLINKYVQILKEGITKTGVRPYNSGSGLLRYVQFDVVENTVIAALVINADLIDNQMKELVDFLVEKGVNSLWINFNKRLDNVIFGSSWIQVWGEPYFWRTIAGTPIATTPASFSQANPALFGALVASLRDELRSDAHVVEFYAGNGSVSLPLVGKLASLVAIEANPHTEELFFLSAPSLETISYITGDVSQGLPFIEGADTIIVDPPRKGLDPALLQALKDATEKELFYISCGYTSFLKDFVDLTAAGWALQKARAYLLFPGSDHVELLVSMKKESG